MMIFTPHKPSFAKMFFHFGFCIFFPFTLPYIGAIQEMWMIRTVEEVGDLIKAQRKEISGTVCGVWDSLDKLVAEANTGAGAGSMAGIMANLDGSISYTSYLQMGVFLAKN
jgi:hypothetical protein